MKKGKDLVQVGILVYLVAGSIALFFVMMKLLLTFAKFIQQIL